MLPFFASAFSRLTQVTKRVEPINSAIIAGDTPPLGYFDPLDFSNKFEKYDVQYLREAELKHGRYAMLASLIIPFSERFSSELGINQFQHLDSTYKYIALGSVLVYEFAHLLNGWKNPISDTFELKEDYQPGDIGLGLFNPEDTKSVELLNKELNNGRLAMIGVLGMIGQELVTQHQLL
jgi:hypothetical protein